ncbi:MAG: hypothetical protein GFH27_549309n138 [Chloroflexi bacterium AL-W]|nr:hypothetical protein [Chloroflexi bacterium AL-N1]NOK69840.1 hypothetical protein [Chloroflexi bacterium AL-N10]NOK73556.1 hypothetical protein [Chloroflexi bacterium AL-N5]NOK84010.1 hypothetical protein [Chloroflexi bacterium AL-W]NOK87887.1 hypothetical protein [Chloroflexi bacterium AL-N15]
MVRKLIATFVAIGLCFSMTLGAAASPLSSAPERNLYTQSAGPEAGPEPDNVAGMVVAGVALVALAYEIGKQISKNECLANGCGSIQFTSNEQMELLFDR